MWKKVFVSDWCSGETGLLPLKLAILIYYIYHITDIICHIYHISDWCTWLVKKDVCIWLVIWWNRIAALACHHHTSSATALNGSFFLCQGMCECVCQVFSCGVSSSKRIWWDQWDQSWPINHKQSAFLGSKYLVNLYLIQFHVSVYFPNHGIMFGVLAIVEILNYRGLPIPDPTH